MRVLSIDGGGIRGLIPAIVLTEIERRSGDKDWGVARWARPILDVVFDRVPEAVT